MIEGLHSSPYALGHALDVMIQRGLGVEVPQMGLHVLHAGGLPHIRGTRTSQHLMRHTVNPGLFSSVFQHAEQEIVRINSSVAAGREMNAPGVGSLTFSRQNSSSVEIEAGNHTAASLPSVLVSTSTPSLTLLS